VSEARIACLFCRRPPGGIHNDFCPRSAVIMRELHDAAKRVRPIHFWSKGPLVVRLPGEDAKATFNPGIPYVRQAPNKSWKAGGVPHGSKEMVDAFKRSLTIPKNKS